jgi:hypothetical protein
MTRRFVGFALVFGLCACVPPAHRAPLTRRVVDIARAAMSNVNLSATLAATGAEFNAAALPPWVNTPLPRSPPRIKWDREPVSKNAAVKDHSSMQLRLAAFYALNRPQFGGWSLTQTSPFVWQKYVPSERSTDLPDGLGDRDRGGGRFVPSLLHKHS